MPDIVERYLDAIVCHDWGVVAACITADIVRIGPYSDRFDGRAAYLAYLSQTMPRLEGYSMELHRVTYVGGQRAYAELSETVTVDRGRMLTPEVLVFELDEHGRIARVEIFIQTPHR